LTATFTANTEKYRTILNNATDADKIVRDKFDRHRSSIEMLSKGPAEMQKNLPSSGGVKGSPAVAKLKALMEDVETIKCER
jgi:programmed cell death 6-interacting protein